jgi:hypothetical protein
MPDDKTPTPGEIVIMASGAVALVFSFFHFFDDRSAWGGGYFPIATLPALLVVVMAAHVALTKYAGVSLPDKIASFSWTQIHLALGFFAALDAFCFLIVKTYGAGKKVGFWFILIASIAALVGAILLQRERAGAAGPSA